MKKNVLDKDRENLDKRIDKTLNQSLRSKTFNRKKKTGGKK